MGYEISLKVDLETLDQEFKPFINDPDLKNLCEEKNILLTACISQPHITDMFEIRKFVKNFRMNFDIFIQYLEQKWKCELVEDLKQEGGAYFCGRAYANECDYDFDEVIETTFSNLCVLAYCVDTPNIHEDDEAFWDYRNKINSEIESLEETICDKWNHKFVDKYKHEPKTTESY